MIILKIRKYRNKNSFKKDIENKSDSQEKGKINSDISSPSQNKLKSTDLIKNKIIINEILENNNSSEPLSFRASTKNVIENLESNMDESTKNTLTSSKHSAQLDSSKIRK